MSYMRPIVDHLFSGYGISDEVISSLAPRERILLTLLITKEGKMVNHDMAQENLCDCGEDATFTGFLTLIHRLRKKLRNSPVEIITVENNRYIFVRNS